MVLRALEKHKQHLNVKFSDAEYSHVEEILVSAEEFLQKSSNLLFLSAIVVVFTLSFLIAFVVLPFKSVLPPVLFYGGFGVSAFVFGILILYFIHINAEFERHHHFLLLLLFVVFSFISVFVAHLILASFMNSVVVGSVWSEWLVATISSFGFLIPYLLYWLMVE